MHVEKLFWEQNCVVFSIHKEHDVTVSVILEFGKIPPKEPGTWSFWLYLCVHARACVCCYIEPDTRWQLMPSSAHSKIFSLQHGVKNWHHAGSCTGCVTRGEEQPNGSACPVPWGCSWLSALGSPQSRCSSVLQFASLLTAILAAARWKNNVDEGKEKLMEIPLWTDVCPELCC